MAIEGGALGAELEVALDDTGGVRANGSIGIDDLKISDTIERMIGAENVARLPPASRHGDESGINVRISSTRPSTRASRS